MASKVFSVYEPVYESSCAFYVGVPFDRVMTAVRKAADPDWLAEWGKSLESHRTDGGFCLGFEGKSGMQAFVVWVKDEWTCDSICLLTLTHEILHLAMAILDAKGTPIQRSNDEVICRMQSFYLRKCLNRLLAEPKKVAA